MLLLACTEHGDAVLGAPGVEVVPHYAATVDVKDGAVWEINYVDGKGFTLKNKYTGKYLKDATAAKYDDPVYMDFLKAGVPTGIHALGRSTGHDAVYTLQGIKIATQQQWDALPSGVYIVGGKKIMK